MSDQTPKEAAEELAPYVAPFQNLIQKAYAGKLQISNVEEYEIVAAHLKGIRQVRNKIKEIREEFYGPAKKVADKLAKHFKTMDKPLEELEKYIKKEGTAFIKEAFAELQEDTAKRVEAAKEAGNEDLANALAEVAKHKLAVPPVDGVGLRVSTEFEILNEFMLPKEYTRTVPDERKIRDLVRLEGTRAEDTLNGAIRVFKSAGMNIYATEKKPKLEE